MNLNSSGILEESSEIVESNMALENFITDMSTYSSTAENSESQSTSPNTSQSTTSSSSDIRKLDPSVTGALPPIPGLPSARMEENDEDRLDAMRQKKTLFVGDISRTVDEETLANLFLKFGPLSMVDIKKDKYSGNNLGYAFVEFVHRKNAENAKRCLHGAELEGRMIRVGWAQKNSTIFLALIPGDVSSEDFSKYMAEFGDIIEDETFISRHRFGFVKYRTQKTAEMVKSELDNKLLYLPTSKDMKAVKVRADWGDSLTQRNCVHIQFDPTSWAAEKLNENIIRVMLSDYGQTQKISLPRYADNRLKGYGFIHFQEDDDGEVAAAKAILELDAQVRHGVEFRCNFGKRQIQRPRANPKKPNKRANFRNRHRPKHRQHQRHGQFREHRRRGKNKYSTFDTSHLASNSHHRPMAPMPPISSMNTPVHPMSQGNNMEYWVPTNTTAPVSMNSVGASNGNSTAAKVLRHPLLNNPDSSQVTVAGLQSLLKLLSGVPPVVWNAILAAYTVNPNSNLLAHQARQASNSAGQQNVHPSQFRSPMDSVNSAMRNCFETPGFAAQALNAGLGSLQSTPNAQALLKAMSYEMLMNSPEDAPVDRVPVINIPTLGMSPVVSTDDSQFERPRMPHININDKRRRHPNVRRHDLSSTANNRNPRSQYSDSKPRGGRPNGSNKHNSETGRPPRRRNSGRYETTQVAPPFPSQKKHLF